MRDAVLDFKKSGKPLYAYLEYGGDREYYLASAADKVFLMPSSPLDLTGVATYAAVPARHARQDRRVSGSAPHRRLQDRGRTRSPRRATPPAHREMDESLNRDLYEQIVRGIADGRKKSDDGGPRADRRGSVPARGRAARRPGRRRARTRIRSTRSCAADERAAAQIDGDDYGRVSAASLGLEPGPAHRRHLRGRHDRQRQERLRSGQRRDRRLRHADRVHPRRRGATRSMRAHRAADRQPRRIGDGVRRDLARADDRARTSARIGRSSRRCRISPRRAATTSRCRRRSIVAQPSTLTGSIGIFGGKFVTGGVYEKLGAQHRVDEHRQARRDQLAGAPVQRRRAEEGRRSSCRPSTTSSSRRSPTSRHSTPEKIDAIAQGRVWTGRQAKENGLVDALGGLDRAIAHRQGAREDRRRQRRRAGRLSAARRASTSCCRSSSAARASQLAVGAWLSANLSSGRAARRCARCAGRSRCSAAASRSR